MIEPYIRPLYQEFLCNPLARLVGKTLSPNKITVLGIFTGIGVAPALFYDQVTLALILLTLTGLFDTLDGTVARLFYQTSPYGTALDIIGDRIVEFAILLGLFLVSPEVRALDVLMMLGSILICVTSFLVVGIFSENCSHKSFHYSHGLMERPEAFVFFAAMIFFPDHFHILALFFSFLVILTAVIRMVEFKKSSK